ncbi:hypothetical protein GUITHDRAFT_103061 [Guillardia theta CCMP2712]|uniref:Thioredoxin domain-containing protein n=2 Tax=Guillardia theta TaxID=55529 RepID=L1JSH4_GUITC|nr:hypothetical protein GUITHDRAFT_103061 [Guillardia theta CCMP2712]EKX51140.1 hypothetical protein GUITHDRAFT_103061 [Guillardia theta CCMP2712]|eukprot:XP_005838120.1 hypothetical protein GUITHDRAFT_103061 [Guillardia theta CCMP2712]
MEKGNRATRGIFISMLAKDGLAIVTQEAGMGRTVLLFLFCLASSSLFHVRSSPADPWEGDVDTVILDRNNFTSYVQSQKLVMVEFYTPWCGHCRGFAPLYAQAAKQLKKDGIPLAKVNMDQEMNHPFAGEFGISGFPTIRVFKRMYDSDPNQPLGTLERWDNEERTTERVVTYMREIGLPPREVTSSEELDKILEANVDFSDQKVSSVVLGVFPEGENSKKFEAFKEAKFGRLLPLYVWVKDASLAKKWLSEEDQKVKEGVFVITKYTQDPKGPVYRLEKEKEEDVDGIVRFVDVHGAPVVWYYSDALTNQITTGKLQKFLWAFVEKGTEQWAQYDKVLHQVALDKRGEMKFVLVPGEAQGLLQFFRMDRALLPQIMIIDLHPEVGQRQFKYGKLDKKTKQWNTDKAKNIDADELNKFLEKYNSGKLKRFLRSEPVPVKQEGSVVTIVGDTFEETIRSGKDVLINFYGDFSWCKHCEAFEPEYAKVGEFFKQVKSLVIAKMDFPANDIEDAKKRGMEITGYPDVYLFRAGEHHLKPIRFDSSKYNNERGLGAISQFVMANVAIPFQSSKGEVFGGKKREEL